MDVKERELSSYSTEQIEAIIVDWMGGKGAADVRAAAEAINKLISLDDRTREYALHGMRAFICDECGSDTRGRYCYCRADD